MKEDSPKKNREIAAALRYQPEENGAPVVVAEGKGHMAGLIKEIADKNDIPVYKDEALADTLSQLGVGSEIPEYLYEAVAEILVFVAGIDKKLKS
ncbi:MAG: EscU/YscU/HrcU family type III secretion system export apparatus switch protein [Clostridiales bacterium]|nr:EscU/YscU/HrcU family type III secretion system export apparatus switch protein [Clostridiales bacterium]MCF8022419.1 EscU/YscU/HrcU family type III secretion system export apparatus switch protein [Clostridiales bacterium]